MATTATSVSSPFLPRPRSPVVALRRLASRRQEQERCELCRAEIDPAQHRHLLEAVGRQIRCACEPCALCFEGVQQGRFQLIPRTPRAAHGFQLTEIQWDLMALPIGLAFIYYDTPRRQWSALFPSPGGPTESLQPLSGWDAFAAQDQTLSSLQPDVEALLLNRLEGAREYLIVPIDRCFELVGLLRRHWRGLSGGEAVWHEVERFFVLLRGQAEEGS